MYLSGCSSVGRARALGARGREFESYHSDHKPKFIARKRFEFPQCRLVASFFSRIHTRQSLLAVSGSKTMVAMLKRAQNPGKQNNFQGKLFVFQDLSPFKQCLCIAPLSMNIIGATDCGIIQARISGRHAGVAQSVEQGIFNAQVAGSSPVASPRRVSASFLFGFLCFGKPLPNES